MSEGEWNMKIRFYQTSWERSNYHHERFGKLTFRPLTLRIRSDKGLTLETSAFQIFHGGNSTFINSFDKTKFSSFYVSSTLYVCLSYVRVTVPRTASTNARYPFNNSPLGFSKVSCCSVILANTPASNIIRDYCQCNFWRSGDMWTS